jgi:RimJ/RimL family protein N-acetyltransferase
MELTLRRFTEDDLQYLPSWREEIGSDRYMERLRPVSFDSSGFEGWGRDYVWSVICADGRDVGCIWIESRRNNSSIGILGIIIGRSGFLGRGLGRAAIEAAIPAAREMLGFDVVRLHVRRSNLRAIACYGKCGFVVTGEGAKPYEDGDKVPFYRMELFLGPCETGGGSRRTG